MFATMDSGTVAFLAIMLVVLVPCGIWLAYMATCKPEVLMKLREQENEIRQKRHERMKEMAKGTFTAGSLAYRLLKKK